MTPSTIDAANAPRGLDRATVRKVASDSLAALVSSLDAATYSDEESVGECAGDPAWLTPRAMAHDAVVTWAGDASVVVPFPMWVMFRDPAAVSDMLVTRRDELADALNRVAGAREFGVRVSGDSSALAAAAETIDSQLAVIEQQASLAPPGQAYLLRRKLGEARKAATRDAATRIAERTHDALTMHARSSVTRATALSREPGVLLDAAYLVPDVDYEPFRAALTELIAAYEPAGLRFDFTGPWPPYHFVRAG